VKVHTSPISPCLTPRRKVFPRLANLKNE
jgi:hypothetical protein